MVEGMDIGEMCSHRRRSIESSNATLPIGTPESQIGERKVEKVLSGTTSQIAILNRELRNLEIKYFRLRVNFQKSLEKSDTIRAEMKNTRLSKMQLERECTKLRSLVNTIQSEKKALVLQAATNRDYAKKIEQKLFVGAKGLSLVQCNLQLGERLKATEGTVKEKEKNLERLQVELAQVNDKVKVLQRALEIRFEELQINGSVHYGILYELSKLQECNSDMAKHLKHQQELNNAAEKKIKQLQAIEEELHENLAVKNAVVTNLESEQAALKIKLNDLSNESKTAGIEKATMLKFIQEQAETKFNIESALHQLREDSHQQQTNFQNQIKCVEEHNYNLFHQIEDLKNENRRLEGELQNCQSIKRRDEQTIERLTTEAHALELRVQTLSDNLRSAQEQSQATSSVCEELRVEIDQHTAELESQKQLMAKQEETNQQLQKRAAVMHQQEEALQKAMERALHDMETLASQRNEAAKAMNEAVVISTKSLEEQQFLENKLELQRKQLEQVQSSKKLLQNAMIEQLSALRKQLQQERLQRIDFETKLKGVDCSKTMIITDHFNPSTHPLSCPSINLSKLPITIENTKAKLVNSKLRGNGNGSSSSIRSSCNSSCGSLSPSSLHVYGSVPTDIAAETSCNLNHMDKLKSGASQELSINKMDFAKTGSELPIDLEQLTHIDLNELG